MIKLLDGYYIKTEEYGYSLCKGDPKVEVTPERTYKRHNIIGYYGSVGKAVEACRQELVHERFSSGCDSLTEALGTIREIDNRFEELMKGINV